MIKHARMNLDLFSKNERKILFISQRQAEEKKTYTYIVRQSLYEDNFYDYLRTALLRLFDDSCSEGAVSTAVQNIHNCIIITDTAPVIHLTT